MNDYDILDEFLQRWDYAALESMTLDQYSDVKNRDTFCYWVEIRTKALGGIQGMPSQKFGIFRRNSRAELRKTDLVTDGEYAWYRRFGTTRAEAFQNVKSTVLQISKLARVGKFEDIDNLFLPSIFKWKVAFLYSNERLIPIFNRNALAMLAGYISNGNSAPREIHRIQELLVSKKPLDSNVFDYMRVLYGIYQQSRDSPASVVAFSSLKCIKSQIRNGPGSYIAQQLHNEIQNALYLELVKKYGSNAVFIERDDVDITVEIASEIVLFEVKSSPFPHYCIREGLGQVLHYASRQTPGKTVRVVIVGLYDPTAEDIVFINYLKRMLNIDFEYAQQKLS